MCLYMFLDDVLIVTRSYNMILWRDDSPIIHTNIIKFRSAIFIIV